MAWCVTEIQTSRNERMVHTYPLDEAGLHAFNGTLCQCDPRIERFPGAILITHNTKDEALKKAN